ncbi:hypothetical protein ABZP36_020327 [Zizania latifolia]
MMKVAMAVACAVVVLATACHGLELGYYKKSCPRVEAIVRDEVKKFIYKDAGISAGLIRLIFHDCFVQDIVSPNALDNQYYKNILAHKVLFTSDATLLTSPATTNMVTDNANIPGWWEDRFAKAFVKMAAIDVNTGYQGEIRRKCRVVN